MPNLLQNSPFSHFKFSSLNFYNILCRCTSQTIDYNDNDTGSPDYAYTDLGGEKYMI